MRLAFFCWLVLWGCQSGPVGDVESKKMPTDPFLMVLGTAQDAGYPQIGCKKACCKRAWENYTNRRYPASMAIVDPDNQAYWIIDASPEIKNQLDHLEKRLPETFKLKGIFLTHAHIGHYTGLMHFGREAMDAKKLPVYAMPRMNHFLSNNGPWSQLVELENIQLMPLQADLPVELGSKIRITPFSVPHRDEFSETVGYEINANKKAVYIPDIDKWDRWDKNVVDVVKMVDYAFLDGTFYNGEELSGRNMSEIPHPFIVESIDLFKELDESDIRKIHFIHLNHSNLILDPYSPENAKLSAYGLNVAEQFDEYSL